MSVSRLVPAAVLLAAGVLFFARLGDRAVVSEELRWAEVAREMRLSGDPLRPTINGQIYYDKPLGSYWLIVATSVLTGEVDEATARLPAAVAGWVGVLLVMLLAARLYDRPTAILAGAVLATCWGFAFYARRATADAETATGVLAAVLLYARAGGRGGPWVVGLWLLMAATSLTKGLLGFALPLLVLGVDGTLAGRAAGHPWWRAVVAGNRWLFTRWSLLAVPVGVLVYAAPFVGSMAAGGSAVGVEMVLRENVRRFVAPHNHTGPAYLYVGAIAVLAAPWAAFLPAALCRPPLRTDGDRLARVYFWAVFLFFTASASRRSYYLLPVLPAAALLVARVLTAADLGPVARRLRSIGYSVVGLAVAAGVGAVLLPADWRPAAWRELPELPGRGWVAAGAAVLALFWASRRVRDSELGTRNSVLGTAVVAFLGVGYALLVALPAADAVRTRRAFAAEVRDRTADAPGRLALFRARDAVFDLAPPAPLPDYPTADAVAAGVRAGAVRYLLVRAKYRPDVPVPAAVVAVEPAAAWEGPEQTGDKLVLLAVGP